MKTLIQRIFLSVSLLSAHLSQAQYANGTGTGLHQNQIFWLGWGGAALVTTPAGFTSTHIIEGTYIWDLEPGLVRVVGVVDNIENPVTPNSGTLTITPYNSGTYVGNGTTSLGDGLQLMYPGVNPIGMATKNSVQNGSYQNGIVEFDINLKLQMLINGTWTDLNYPGMVMADAESMASNGSGTEYISAETNGTTGWQILDVRNNAASIGQNPTNYKLQVGNSGKYFKLYNNRVDNMGVQAVMYAQGTTTLTNVQMQGQGITALALGFIAPFDYGDAPASYGEVPHYIDNLTLNGTPISSDGTYSVTNQTIASLVVPTANVYINKLPDPDGGLSHFSPNADIDGATTVPDYDGSGTYTLTIPITNNTGQPSNLGAWIDWNQNGVFDASEAVLQTNPASQTSASFTWTGLTMNPDPAVNYFVRVRVTTDPLTSPNAGATDGEVEDYALRASIMIAGNVFDDADGLKNSTVDGTGTNIGGVLYVNLVDNAGNVVASVPVASDGTYEFGGNSSGNYTLQLTTNQGVPGSPAPAVVLPNGWISTGENHGVSAGNDGLVNTILPVTLTSGTPVYEADFGVEVTPQSDSKTTVIAQPVPNQIIPLDGNTVPSLSGSDPEDQPVSASLGGKSVAITSLPTNGELYYNNVLITVGEDGVNPVSPTNPFIISNLDPSLLQVKLTGSGYTSTSFDYAYIDAAGKPDATPATYTLNWGSPLPVTLVSFTAVKSSKIAQDNKVLLTWVTTAETNSKGFDIERSSTGKDWNSIGSVDAKGESQVTVNYTFDDNLPLKGQNFYRLKMIDSDETFKYSRIVNVKFDEKASTYVYPNPVSSELSVGAQEGSEIGRIQVYNISGQLMKESSDVTKPLNVSQISSGMYNVRVINKDGSVNSHKVVIKH